jgi:hypothetical protein
MACDFGDRFNFQLGIPGAPDPARLTVRNEDGGMPRTEDLKWADAAD